MQTHNTSPFSTNIIYGSGTNYHKEDHVYEPISGSVEQWHDYVIEWTPDYIKWIVDGVVKRTANKGAASVDFTNKEQHLMMNFWPPLFSPW